MEIRTNFLSISATTIEIKKNRAKKLKPKLKNDQKATPKTKLVIKE
jgi:hypothetical protein